MDPVTLTIDAADDGEGIELTFSRDVRRVTLTNAEALQLYTSLRVLWHPELVTAQDPDDAPAVVRIADDDVSADLILPALRL